MKTQFTSSQFRTLERASEGVKRVTDQLKTVIWKAADIIAQAGETGDEFIVQTTYFKIQYTESRMSGYKMLYVRSLDAYGEEAWGALNFNESLENDYDYLHGDFNCPVKNASKESKIWFIEHYKQVLDAFIILIKDKQAKREQIIASIKELIPANAAAAAGYNDWSNWETWNAFTDLTSYDSTLEEVRKIKTEEELKEYLEQRAIDKVLYNNEINMIENNDDSKNFAKGLILGSLQEINYKELLRALKEV